MSSESTVKKERPKSTKKQLSYSQYATFAKCPHAWKLSYIDGLRKFEPNVHSCFGTAIHEAIQTWLTVLFEQGKREAAGVDVVKIFRNVFEKELAGETTKSRKDDDGNYILDENHEKIYDVVYQPVQLNRGEKKEFISQGEQIIHHITAHDTMEKFFSPDRYDLVGIEIPIDMDIMYNLSFIGFLDIVLREKTSGKIKIIDLKTSTRMWNKYQQNDVVKINQLLMYKAFYSKQFNIPVNKIDVEFIVLKRTLLEGAAFPESRTQKITPPAGKVMLDEAVGSLIDFIKDGFTPEGQYNKDKKFRKNPHKGSTKYSNCKFCDFSIKNGGDCDRREG